MNKYQDYIISFYISLRRAPTCLLILGLSSCVSVSVKPGHIENDPTDTLKVIAQFHNQFNNSQWAEICRDADESFCRPGSEQKIAENLRQTLMRFGHYRRSSYSISSVREGTEIMGSPSEVHAVCNSEFEKGLATELFIFRRQNNRTRLVQYQIFSGTVRPSL